MDLLVSLYLLNCISTTDTQDPRFQLLRSTEAGSRSPCLEDPSVYVVLWAPTLKVESKEIATKVVTDCIGKHMVCCQNYGPFLGP